MRVPNEMVRLRMRYKDKIPDGEVPGLVSEFVYLYQNCTVKSRQHALLDITVQYRFNREEGYDIIYPPMVIPRKNGTCAHVRNVPAYCKCLERMSGI
ncbi:hypothetical protein GCK32_014873 [Trichostrongylus colubriformis]|uniref:Uncharacterized protein n=1 Tax=Trichostrongylus colubriformis TaxID=6319 RepID=A0AAN8FG28_TRICO